MDMLSLIESAETRSWQLLVQFCVVAVCFTAALVRGRLRHNRILMSMSLLFGGMMITSGYFAWWNHTGRIDFPHHLALPFFGSSLIIIGGMLAVFFAWHIGNRR